VRRAARGPVRRPRAGSARRRPRLPQEAACWHGGLLGITERIAMAGGQLRLVAGPAGGLRLLATLPLPVAAEKEEEQQA